MDNTLVGFVAGTLFGMTSIILVYPYPWMAFWLFLFGLALAISLYTYFHQSVKLGFNSNLENIACKFCGAMHNREACPRCKTRR
jgi:hypothetical protein